MIGKMLGPRRVQTTARYAHLGEPAGRHGGRRPTAVPGVMIAEGCNSETDVSRGALAGEGDEIVRDGDFSTIGVGE